MFIPLVLCEVSLPDQQQELPACFSVYQPLYNVPLLQPDELTTPLLGPRDLSFLWLTEDIKSDFKLFKINTLPSVVSSAWQYIHSQIQSILAMVTATTKEEVAYDVTRTGIWT